ncbi:dehydrogenase [Streptomyces griseoflavus]|uniref:NADH-quinone oxidoreductase subunit C n=1 Tax=Streptomyces griseoflavus TaxID=35619 RepID=UPI0019886835|nr:NADH-quinone oxidoreductase subunit C [Streptomyces griseoflavus]GGV34266.1 dehydrogenase [Streptomyces griseoflavus]
MTAAGWLPDDTGELFGADATAEESYGVLTVDVPPASWITALETARDRLGCTFFDWLSAVDEPGTGFRVTAHVAALGPVRRLLLRTTVAHDAPTLPSAVGVYAGAAWHERETHEMFGVAFTGHPGLDHLLLPDAFEGHPLRKDFVLAARVAKAWPGAKEPGESEHGGPRRRQMLPPGVPDPNEWGPLKGQLPPAPSRPARGTARPAAGTPRTPAERPPRRTRSASEGSASQTSAPEAPGVPRRSRSASEGSASQTASAEAVDRPSTPPRRSRSASEGSASQSAQASPEQAAPTARRARSASEGSASQRSGGAAAGGPRRARSASEGSASRRAVPDEAPPTGDEPTPTGTGRPDGPPPAAPRSPDAPWHHARPAFTEPAAESPPEPGAEPAPEPGAEPALRAGADEPGADEPGGDEPGGDDAPRPTGRARATEQTTESETGPGTQAGPETETEAGPGTETGPGTEAGPGTGTTTPDDPAGGPR